EEPVAIAGGHVIFDGKGNRILTDAGHELIAIDIDTRQKSVLATPVELSFNMPGTMPLDTAGNRLIHTDGRLLWALSLDTYTNTLLSTQESDDDLGAADLD